MKRSRLRNWAVAAALLLLPTVVAASPGALGADEAKKDDRPTIDATQVYYGRAATCKTPAVVDADRAFRAIPEYKKILDDKLTDADARYSLLLVKATRKFRAAVEAAATAGGYDLVANTGAVDWPGHDVPDITDSILQSLEEAEKAR